MNVKSGKMLFRTEKQRIKNIPMLIAWVNDRGYSLLPIPVFIVNLKTGKINSEGKINIVFL